MEQITTGVQMLGRTLNRNLGSANMMKQFFFSQDLPNFFRGEHFLSVNEADCLKSYVLSL